MCKIPYVVPARYPTFGFQTSRRARRPPYIPTKIPTHVGHLYFPCSPTDIPTQIPGRSALFNALLTSRYYNPPGSPSSGTNCLWKSTTSIAQRRQFPIGRNEYGTPSFKYPRRDISLLPFQSPYQNRKASNSIPTRREIYGGNPRTRRGEKLAEIN